MQNYRGFATHLGYFPGRGAPDRGRKWQLVTGDRWPVTRQDDEILNLGRLSEYLQCLILFKLLHSLWYLGSDRDPWNWENIKEHLKQHKQIHDVGLMAATITTFKSSPHLRLKFDLGLYLLRASSSANFLGVWVDEVLRGSWYAAATLHAKTDRDRIHGRITHYQFQVSAGAWTLFPHPSLCVTHIQSPTDNSKHSTSGGNARLLYSTTKMQGWRKGKWPTLVTVLPLPTPMRHFWHCFGPPSLTIFYLTAVYQIWRTQMQRSYPWIKEWRIQMPSLQFMTDTVVRFNRFPTITYFHLAF